MTKVAVFCGEAKSRGHTLYLLFGNSTAGVRLRVNETSVSQASVSCQGLVVRGAYSCDWRLKRRTTARFLLSCSNVVRMAVEDGEHDKKEESGELCGGVVVIWWWCVTFVTFSRGGGVCVCFNT